VWDIATGKEIRHLVTKDKVNRIFSLPDGRHVLSYSALKNVASVWDLEKGEESGRLQHDDGIICMTVSPDGKRALSRGKDGVRLWDLTNCAQFRRFEGPQFSTAVLAFSPDGRGFISADRAAHKLRLWNSETGEELRSFLLGSVPPFTRIVSWVDFSPDGRYVVASTWDKPPDDKTGPIPDQHGVSVWDFRSGKEVVRLVGHTEQIRKLAISSDGRWVLTGSSDSTARLWALP
jgi:WD40 repeat protein